MRLDYPVKILTVNRDGAVVGERTIRNWDEAIDDPAMPPKMRSDLLMNLKTNPETAEKVIKFFRKIIEDPETEEGDRLFQATVLEGVGPGLPVACLSAP